MNESTEARRDVAHWFCMNEKGGFDFNHFEDDHAEADKPFTKYPGQSGCAKGKWVRGHAWLDNNASPKVIHDSGARTTRILATALGQACAWNHNLAVFGTI